MALHLSNIRKEYDRGRLLEADVGDDPIALFHAWLEDAAAQGMHEPNAMTLATSTSDGRPSARMVLLRGATAAGFDFFTNYESRKGEELAQNPWAALVFWWGPLERQIRIEGAVAKLAPQESDAYYHSRPKGSRLGAWVSAQSRVIPDRSVLEARHAELEAHYAETEPERPPFWGGYRLTPTLIEFWQGGPHRLHDRLCYQRADYAAASWRVERLSP
jgi:pyridoxamine 5'-phosphate oxidase